MKRRKEAIAFHRGKLKNMHRTAFFVSSKRLKKYLNKDISASELEVIKMKIRKRSQKEKKSIRIITVVLFSFFGLLALYFWEYLF